MDNWTDNKIITVTDNPDVSDMSLMIYLWNV